MFGSASVDVVEDVVVDAASKRLLVVGTRLTDQQVIDAQDRHLARRSPATRSWCATPHENSMEKGGDQRTRVGPCAGPPLIAPAVTR